MGVTAILLLGCVSTSTASEAVTFRRDVMAVLSKSGCNLGACHGNARGKGGFRLSLRGQDAEFDHFWMTRESSGRRINRTHPDDSLVLLKPLGKLAHEGGKRIQEGSWEHKVLRTWIAGGALRDSPGDKRLVRLTATPEVQYLEEPTTELQLKIVAEFEDGATYNVSREATYETSNLMAEISPEGKVYLSRRGEITVVARYLDLQAVVRLASVPHSSQLAATPWKSRNYIDEILTKKWKRLRIVPSELSSDHVFLRRAYLDALGVLPTAAEARAFADNSDPDKRERLIDALLVRPEFADHWTLKWSDILRNEEKVLDRKGVEVYHAWIREQMEANTGIDKFVRNLIRATGSTYENPAANFWRANRTPTVRGETTARLFLGVRLQCAKCHNHPFDRWTQDDYYRWASVFSRIDYEIVENERRDRFDKNEFIGEQRVEVRGPGTVRNPQNGRPAEARMLGGPDLNPGSYHDPLTPAAIWLTSPENRRFAEVQANFIWYHLMGRGLVEPIDDFRITNPASVPELLDRLALEFTADAFDLRRLVRTIMTSRTYQLSAEPNETNRADEANFSRAIVARLPAEKLLDAQNQALGIPGKFAGYPPGIRAGQLPGVQKVRRRDEEPANGDRFLKMFGKPARLLGCECERSNETTLNQAFLLIGSGLHDRLADSRNVLTRWASSDLSDESLVKKLYWSALGRAPSAEEINAGVDLLKSAPQDTLPASLRGVSGLLVAYGVVPELDDRLTRLQDLAWAVLNSKEFLFRH